MGSPVLADNGAHVVLADINESRLQAATSKFARGKSQVLAEAIDIGDRHAVNALFDRVAAHFGHIDVVFANAGIDPGLGFVGTDGIRTVAGALDNLDYDNWQRVININLNGALFTMQAAARHMKPKMSGKIVVTTSIASRINVPGVGASYFAAKAGIAHVMRQAALELARFNIQVNAIAPGAFATHIANDQINNPLIRRLLESSNPQKRIANTEEIKGVALMLASGASSYMNGVEVVVDGGRCWGLGTRVNVFVAARTFCRYSEALSTVISSAVWRLAVS